MAQDIHTGSVSIYEKTYGKCIVCGKRVKSSDQYITAVEGYAHRKCIGDAGIMA